MAKRMIEKRKRGFVGWIMMLTFWGVNVLMALFVGLYLVALGDMEQPVSEAGRAGQALGIMTTVGFTVTVWAALAIITGLLAYMTRGRKEIIEVDQ